MCMVRSEENARCKDFSNGEKNLPPQRHPSARLRAGSVTEKISSKF
jgi:hypothetical protein